MAVSNVIEYWAFATTANSTDFGDLSAARTYMGCAFGDGTKGVVAGGSTDGSTKTNIIEYVNIASLGNATDFGDLDAAKMRPAGCSNGPRGVIAGGQT